VEFIGTNPIKAMREGEREREREREREQIIRL